MGQGVLGAAGFHEQASRKACWLRQGLHFSIPNLDSFSMLENGPKCMSLMQKAFVESGPCGWSDEDGPQARGWVRERWARFFLQMKSGAPISLLNYEKTGLVMTWFCSWNWGQELWVRFGCTKKWNCLKEEKCLLKLQKGRGKTPLGHLIREMENRFSICIKEILKLFVQELELRGKECNQSSN